MRRLRLSFSLMIVLLLLFHTGVPLSAQNAAPPSSSKPAPEVQALLDRGLEAEKSTRLEDALRLYNAALEKSRAIPDQIGEATVLTQIGIVYRTMGLSQKALTFYEQALPLHRA